ncbi:Rieske (2Fe-2S) protein [Pseudochelatococcus sp. B33]
MKKIVVCRVSEFPEGTRRLETIAGRPIVIFNVKGEFFALLNRCPHQAASLCHGVLTGVAESSEPGLIEYSRQGEMLRCPWHGWEFDVRTGQSWFNPLHTKVKLYPTEVRSGSELIKGDYKAETFEVELRDDYVVVTV